MSERNFEIKHADLVSSSEDAGTKFLSEIQKETLCRPSNNEVKNIIDNVEFDMFLTTAIGTLIAKRPGAIVGALVGVVIADDDARSIRAEEKLACTSNLTERLEEFNRK